MSLCLSVFLGGCGTLELPGADSAERQREPFIELDNLARPQQQPDDELVVENLVIAAGNLGDRSIGPPVIFPDDPGARQDAVEPVIPTVTMTANRVVERAINDYLQNRRTLLKVWIERSQIYFPMIERIFEEEDIPDELKYIALGESNLLPQARSYAGAAGMWQFMPATARGAGLTINDWVDERLDPEKSTRAAARHLKELHDSYSGNWHLALAGYNCSYRCISRAVRRAGGSIENPPSFWEIYSYLPSETRGFIPKFIAASLIVSNPEMYGIEHSDIGQEYSYDLVHVEGMLSLDDAADLAGVDVATIKRLNPALRKSSLPGNGTPYPLKIPLGSYNRFVTAFANLPEEAKVAPGEYTVRPGDTLAGIARRLETTVAQLQAANDIRGHLIYPDQELLIPGSTGVSTAIRISSDQRQFVEYGEPQFRPIKLGEEFQLVEQAGSTEDEPLMAVSLSADFEDELVPTVYRVRRGDTLGQIAERFDVSMRDIRLWNNIGGSTIYVDQELTLHTAASAPTPRIYEVQRGDNLASIARRFGVSVENLKRWNGLNGDLIFPGQNLQLN